MKTTQLHPLIDGVLAGTQAAIHAVQMITISIPAMQTVMAARGVRAKFNRLAVSQWIADPNRKPQVAEARRLGLTSRHFRRIVRELEQDILK